MLKEYRKLTEKLLKSIEIRNYFVIETRDILKFYSYLSTYWNSTNSPKLIDYIRSSSEIMLCAICSYLLSWQKVPAEVKVTFCPKVGLISNNLVFHRAYIEVINCVFHVSVKEARAVPAIFSASKALFINLIHWLVRKIQPV